MRDGPFFPCLDIIKRAIKRGPHSVPWYCRDKPRRRCWISPSRPTLAVTVAALGSGLPHRRMGQQTGLLQFWDREIFGTRSCKPVPSAGPAKLQLRIKCPRHREPPPRSRPSAYPGDPGNIRPHSHQFPHLNLRFFIRQLRRETPKQLLCATPRLDRCHHGHGVHRLLRCAARVSAQEPCCLRSFRCLQCLSRKEGTPGLVEPRHGRKHRQGYVTGVDKTASGPSRCSRLLQHARHPLTVY